MQTGRRNSVETMIVFSFGWRFQQQQQQQLKNTNEA